MNVGWCVLLVLAATQVQGRTIVDTVARQSHPARQGLAAARNLLSASAGAGPHLSHSARQLRQAGGLGSGWRPGWVARLRWQSSRTQRAAASSSNGSRGHAATAAAATAAATSGGRRQHPIWVDLGGERVEALAAGLEYQDGEEAERRGPADGPLKASRLPTGLVRRHLKIAPYKADEFAAERAAAWQAVMQGQ